MQRTTSLIVVVIVLLGSAASQQQLDSESKSDCKITEISNPDGWNIPGLANAKRGARVVFKNLPGVYLTTLTPTQRESDFTYYFCAPESSARLEVPEFPIAVIKLYAYDVGGHTFAYYVHFLREHFEGGRRVSSGAESQAMFYDLDGKGRFTLRRYPREPVPDLVPDWVEH